MSDNTDSPQIGGKGQDESPELSGVRRVCPSCNLPMFVVKAGFDTEQGSFDIPAGDAWGCKCGMVVVDTVPPVSGTVTLRIE